MQNAADLATIARRRQARSRQRDANIAENNPQRDRHAGAINREQHVCLLALDVLMWPVLSGCSRLCDGDRKPRAAVGYATAPPVSKASGLTSCQQPEYETVQQRPTRRFSPERHHPVAGNHDGSSIFCPVLFAPCREWFGIVGRNDGNELNWPRNQILEFDIHSGATTTAQKCRFALAVVVRPDLPSRVGLPEERRSD